MDNDDRQHLTEEMAARLWRRAADLQAEAARRAEMTPLLAAESGSPGQDSTGYSMAHVRQAAEGAGIAGEFVDAALAEVVAGAAVGDRDHSVLDKIALRFLGRPPDFLQVRRVIAASAEDVFRTMQAVFPASPYNLALREVQGDVLEGGLLVFDVPAVTPLRYTRFEYDMSYPGIKQLLASIHRVEDASCEVVLRGSLRPGRRIAGGVFGTVTAGATGIGAVVGGVGLGMTAGVGLGLGALALVPLVAGLGLVGGATFGGASRAVSRRIYSFSMNRGLRALEGLLGSLNGSVVSAWGSGGRASVVGDATSPGLFGKPAK